MHADQPSAVLSEFEARRLTAEIRADLSSAIDKLRRARHGSAHLALDYSTWHEYVLDQFGDLLRELRLPVAERRALVASLDDARTPVRVQAELMGVSVGTIQNDRLALGKVVPIRRRGASQAAPAGKVYEQALEWLRRQDDRGFTLVELARETGWTEGKASGALSYLTARGMAVRTETRRLGQRAYVAVSSG